MSHHYVAQSLYIVIVKSYTRVRDLLDEARVIEDRKRDISYIHPHQQRGQPPRQPPRETTPLPTTRPTFRTDMKSLEKDISRNRAAEPSRSNRSIAPTAAKGGLGNGTIPRTTQKGSPMILRFSSSVEEDAGLVGPSAGLGPGGIYEVRKSKSTTSSRIQNRRQSLCGCPTFRCWMPQPIARTKIRRPVAYKKGHRQ
jgi:hypothetical protein